MPLALTIQRTTVSPAERVRYLDRLRRRLAHYTAARCRFRVFEDGALPGAFIEVTEADDVATLTAAHASSPEPGLAPARVYTELELS